MRIWASLVLAVCLLSVSVLPVFGAELKASKLECSFWVHASLGLFTQSNYFGTTYPPTALPSAVEVKNASRLLTEDYAANRLYLIYHREFPIEQAQQVFSYWKQACPPEVELVPALVLRMYDQEQTPVFTTNELRSLVKELADALHTQKVAVYDIALGRDMADWEAVLKAECPQGLIRLGLQPGEALRPVYTGAVEDTWSAFCHGKDNERDWLRPGFGAETLKSWVRERDQGQQPIVWNLIVVAWDYKATERGAYPGYDDAAKNMPLPAGRNRLATGLIRRNANAEKFRGFSSDLYILQENSRTEVHDGKAKSFYETLKRGEPYKGYYHTPFQEIVTIYQEMRSAAE